MKEDTARPLAALLRFALSPREMERCELCGVELSEDHAHLLGRDSQKVACSCDACAILFCGQDGAKFRRVPRRILKLEGMDFNEAVWDALRLPINLAYFVRRSDDTTSVFYPSPAGPMSSLLSLPRWGDLFVNSPDIGRVESEVEALLVNWTGAVMSNFIVPIDQCYRLVGLIRTQWRGFSGGSEVWRSVGDFFTSLDHRAIRRGNV